ncbi:heparanase-like isoform X2 [Coccinella septempunctata]|nr:heparanase-like isoform X2 [Coccinella septempunctata]
MGFKTWIFFNFFMSSYMVLVSGRSLTLFFDNYQPIISKIDKKFLSVALDSSVIQNGFKKFNMSDPKLVKMISHISPAYFRVGGNMADRLIFVPNGEKSNSISNYSEEIEQCSHEFCSYAATANFSMYGKDWLLLNNLTKKSNLEMVFDLNVLRRFQNNTWDSRNAEELIKFSDRHRLNVNWQLGNEPNSFRHTFNYEVNASQLAADFRMLKRILKKYERYAKSYVIGPDTTRPEIEHKESMKYLEDFLKNGKGAVDIVSWHQYYFNGRTATESDFLDPAIFDILNWQIDVVKQIQKITNTGDKKVWLAETSSAWGGGSPMFSDKFIASFIWLDKLGVAAKKGLDAVVRQSVFHGNYALISDNLQPNPDYWISVLYKNLVGAQVINCFNATSSKVRLYCHCTSDAIRKNPISLITVYGMNMQDTPAKIRILGLDDDIPTSQKIVAYTISSNGSLLGKDVYSSGVLLRLTPSNELPHFNYTIVNAKPYVLMPPFSIVFWIVPTKSRICY